MKFSNIFVSVDLNKNNIQLIKFCFIIAEKYDATISFLNCHHPTINDINDGDIDQNSKFLDKLSSQVEIIATLHEDVEYSCFTHAGFAAEGIPTFMERYEFDLMVIETSQSKYSLVGSGVSSYMLEKTNIPVIVVPEGFRVIDLNHVVFNLEFEFREIEKIYDLLLMCNRLSAHLSCIHACNKDKTKEAIKNIETYKKMFEGHILDSVIDFELILDEKFKGIEKFAVENEADLIVLGKSRKTWKNQFVGTTEEKLGQTMNIPIMIIEI